MLGDLCRRLPPTLAPPFLGGPDYTLLTAAAVVTNLGSQGALIAAAFAVLDAGGDGGDVGLVAARTLPLVLFLVIAGDARLWQMMMLSALDGTGQAFFNPAAEGMLMSSAGGEQASRAFAMFRMAMQGAGLGGAALGGPCS